MIIQRRTPVRRVSKKRAAQLVLYRKAVRHYLPRFRFCAVCGTARPTQVHHTCGRIGRLLLEERWWLPVCADCQMLVHRLPAWAGRFGYLCPAGHWNGPRESSNEMHQHADMLYYLLDCAVNGPRDSALPHVRARWHAALDETKRLGDGPA